MIAAEYETATLNRRRSPRAPVSLDARLGRGGGLDRTLCKGRMCRSTVRAFTAIPR